MTLSARDRVLYARHLLLPEIGKVGQERLCATHAALPAHADEEAGAVASEYLKRAGLRVGDVDADSIVVPVADAAAVQKLAGEAVLRHAAAAVLGAFAATEVIKQVTGCGTAATFPDKLSFSAEDA